MSASEQSVVHTPGPWRVAKNRNRGFVIDGDRRRVAAVLVGETANDEQIAADARLIAAAPDLLEALQKFIAFHDIDHDSRPGWEIQELYDEAILAAKAAVDKVV